MYNENLLTKVFVIALVCAVCVNFTHVVGGDSSSSAMNGDAISTIDGGYRARDPNLVACWHFDEGSGTTAYDSSGNGNDGTIQGAQWVDGISGKALSFDGNDYVQVPDSSALSIYDSDLSIEAWIKFPEDYTNSSSANGIISKWYQYTFWFRPLADGGGLRLADSESNGVDSPGQVWQGNKWYHVVGVHDESTHWNYLYANGVQIAAVYDPWMSRGTSHELRIGDGSSQYSSRYYFDGVIDEVAIYNRTLSASEIAQHYNSMLGASLTVTTDKATYYTGDNVTLNAVYNNGSANVTFEVDDPDGTALLVHTVQSDAAGEATFTFKLDDNATVGAYVVYATTSDAQANCTFEVAVYVPPPHLLITDFAVSGTLTPGGSVIGEVTIESTFTTDTAITLVLQAINSQNEPLTPAAQQVTITADTTVTYNLTVPIPSNAPTSTYSVQAQLLTALPKNDGYALDYANDSFSVS